jgi:hypothetical protein
MNQRGFNGALCDCTSFTVNFNNLKDSVRKIYTLSVLTAHCLYVYTTCPVQPSETSTKHTLFSIQEKLNIINTMNSIYNFPHKTNHLKFCISVSTYYRRHSPQPVSEQLNAPPPQMKTVKYSKTESVFMK